MYCCTLAIPSHSSVYIYVDVCLVLSMATCVCAVYGDMCLVLSMATCVWCCLWRRVFGAVYGDVCLVLSMATCVGAVYLTARPPSVAGHLKLVVV